MKTTLKIEGMSCPNCAHHVQQALESLPGVSSVVVDLAGGNAIVDHNSADPRGMIAAVDDAGYDARIDE